MEEILSRVNIYFTEPKYYIDTIIETLQNKIDLYFENEKFKHEKNEMKIKQIDTEHADTISQLNKYRQQYESNIFVLNLYIQEENVGQKIQEIEQEFEQKKRFFNYDKEHYKYLFNFEQEANLILSSYKTLYYHEKNNFSIVPKNIPTVHKYFVMTQSVGFLNGLNLGKCKIEKIEQRAFEPLVNTLKTLILRHNKLTEINEDCFNFPNLDWLDLGHNNISKIENGAFKQLVNLTHLDLRDNKLFCQFETNNKPSIFENCIKLKKLVLQKNYLQSLPKNLFKNTIQLEHLELRKNCFNRLYYLNKMFAPFTNRVHIFVKDCGVDETELANVGLPTNKHYYILKANPMVLLRTD